MRQIEAMTAETHPEAWFLIIVHFWVFGGNMLVGQNSMPAWPGKRTYLAKTHMHVIDCPFLQPVCTEVSMFSTVAMWAAAAAALSMGPISGCTRFLRLENR